MTRESEPNLTLRQPWLNIVRFFWVVLFLVYFGSYILALPYTLEKQPQLVSSSSQVSREEVVEALEQRGISLESIFLLEQVTSTLIPLLYLFLGIFIFWRKSNDWMAIFTSFWLINFVHAFGTLAEHNPVWRPIADINDLIGSNIFIAWFFIFPDGRFLPRWMRWVFVVLLATQVWRVIQPDLYSQSFILLIPILFGGILASQIYRYRHAGLAQRQQIKWLVFGVVFGCAPLIIYMFIYFFLLRGQSPVDHEITTILIGGRLWMFFMLALPISLTFAIFRSRLLDIDLIIRRTLLYSLSTGLLALVYFGSVVLLQNLFVSFGGQHSPLIVVLSTLMIAALFNPLRKRVQMVVDRRFFRSKYDAEQALAGFAASARDEVGLGSLADRLVLTIEETVQPESMSLWIKK